MKFVSTSEFPKYVTRKHDIIIIYSLRVFLYISVSWWYFVKFEWQEVSSSLQCSSKYTGLSQQCRSFDCIHSSFHFQVLSYFYQSFGDCTKSTNNKWYKRHFHVPHFLNSLGRSKYLSFFSFSFNFSLWSARTGNFASSLFFVDYCKVWSSGWD